MIQDLFSDPEVVVVIEDIQVLKDDLIGQFISCKANQLVKDRKSISHGPIRFQGDDVQRIFFGFDLLLLRYIFQVSGNIIDGNTPEVKDLATGEDRWNYFMFFRGGEDKFGIFGWLFQGFQKSIESGS